MPGYESFNMWPHFGLELLRFRATSQKLRGFPPLPDGRLFHCISPVRCPLVQRYFMEDRPGQRELQPACTRWPLKQVETILLHTGLYK